MGIIAAGIILRSIAKIFAPRSGKKTGGKSVSRSKKRFSGLILPISFGGAETGDRTADNIIERIFIISKIRLFFEKFAEIEDMSRY